MDEVPLPPLAQTLIRTDPHRSVPAFKQAARAEVVKPIAHVILLHPPLHKVRKALIGRNPDVTMPRFHKRANEVIRQVPGRAKMLHLAAQNFIRAFPIGADP